MEQATLDGTPQPTARNRGGRPRKPEEAKVGNGPLVRFYAEDRAALRDARAAGYTGSDAAVMRQMLREGAARLRAAGAVTTQEELPV